MVLKKIKFCGVLLLLFYSLLSSGQEQQTLTVHQLINNALESSYDIKEAELNVDKSHQLRREALSSGLPQIDGKVEYKKYIDLPVMILPGSLAGSPDDIVADYGKSDNMDIGLQASQLLFSMEYLKGLKAADKAIELYELQKEQTGTELIYSVYNSYYTLLSIYKNIDIVDEHIRSLSQMRDITQSLVEADLALETDVYRLEVNLSNLETAKKKAKTAITIQTNNIKMLAGISKGNLIAIDTTGINDLYSLNNIKLVNNPDFDNLVNQRIEVQLLDKNIELNEMQIKVKKGSYSPVVAAYGSYLKMAQENEFNFFSGGADFRDVSLVGIKMEIPIFKGGKNKAKVKQAIIDKEIAENRRNEAIAGLNVDYQNAINEYETSLLNCRAQKRNTELARKVLEQFQFKYQEGLSGLTDVLLAETELMTARGSYIENMTYFRQAEIKLIKAKGELQSLTNK